MSEKYLEKINDVYFISEQIKLINKNFKLFYNKKTNLYEVRDNNNIVVTYQNYPDSNLIEKLHKTNKHNMKKLFLEIDEQNEKIIKNKEKELLTQSQSKISEIFGYLKKQPSKDLSLTQLKNILE